jgi:hypothetical protein
MQSIIGFAQIYNANKKRDVALFPPNCSELGKF